MLTSLDDLLDYLYKNNGSDLHLSVGAKPRIRVQGNLEDVERTNKLMPADMEELLYPLLDTREKAILNTTGQYDLSYQLGNEKRFRVNMFRQKHDLAAVFRLLNNSIIDITKLGIPQKVLDLYTEKRGMVLVVGPTGSGKTTTLTGIIDKINTDLPSHVITLEDPVEYLHWHKKALVNQREIGSDCDSFANGLRSALREDPDVILVGEIRDTETAEIALTAAETGHLLLSTLHTLGSVETINRLVTMFPPDMLDRARDMIADTLKAVVSQQLLPKVGGGRVAVFETLFINSEVKEYIRNNQPLKIKEYMESEEGIADGCITMDSSILSLWDKGIITPETTISYALNRKMMRTLVM